MATADQSTPGDIPGLTELTLVGSGGFAAVYRAKQPELQRTVAVKVLSAPHVDERSRARFSRECRAMGSLSEHPNIVTLHHAGFTSDGRAFLVMAYLAGGSLEDRISRTGVLGWEDAVVVGAQVAGALAAAHRAGVLHRDVKPANVLLSRYGTSHLGDFGIARMAEDSASQGITATLAYAAPEVLLGAAPTPASDLYSLGATLYEVITGSTPHPPRPEEEAIAWIRRIADEPAPRLDRTYVPIEVRDLIDAMLATDPASRPASASAVQAALRSIAAQHHLEGLESREGVEADAGPTPPRPEPEASAMPPDDGATVVLGPSTPGPGTMTPPPPVPPGTPPPPPAGYQPTHRVALSGAPAWEAPDPNRHAVAVLDPWLDVALVGQMGMWAQVLCSNGWTCWVDLRRLEPHH